MPSNNIAGALARSDNEEVQKKAHRARIKGDEEL